MTDITLLSFIADAAPQFLVSTSRGSRLEHKGFWMSSISCPYCQHVMKLTGVTPGLFHPACPECRAQFELTISADASVAPKVVALGVLPHSATIAEESHSTAAARHEGGSQSAVATMAAPPTPRVPPSYDAAVASSHKATAETVDVGFAGQTVAERYHPPAAPAWERNAAQHMRLGGYEIIKTLGEGGMGRVYLANQTSLARHVALKVLSPRLASDSQFIARFTREAFAAAQLTHHNVVQIHDIGVEHSKDGSDTNFFSMELVEGRSLGAVVAKAGKLDPEKAVGYVLQAARGLKFAHDHGLIHRDVKPDNLLLNTQEVVKVADLGLVKRAGVSEPAAAVTLSHAQAAAAAEGKTLPSAVMGTPDYMPPEQARDAGAVDARADIYSLGCTLYEMLTGRAPFAGRSVEAVLAAHASEEVVPPDRVAHQVPSSLSQIVRKMLAKRPEDRYANMDEVIVALERTLGVDHEKPFAPPQDQLKILELSGESFHNCAWRAVRVATIRGFFTVLTLAMIVLALPTVGHPFIAAAVLEFAVTTIVAYQLIYGTSRRTYFMSKLRQLAFGSSLADWVTYFVFAALAVGLQIAFGVQWIWLGSSIGAILTAAAFFGIVDAQLAHEREIPLQQTERMLKALRLHGVDENTLRHFVCRYCGRNWEEFYEVLFGYEAKIKARQAWNRGELGRSRPRYAAWRDPIIEWIDRHAEVHREERQRKLLTRLETEALQAGGMEPYEANIQARQSTSRLMENAAAVRSLAYKRSSDGSRADGAPVRSVANAEAVPRDWMSGDTNFRGHRGSHGSYFQRRYGSPLNIVFGRGVRLVGAMLLLIGFGLWWSHNGAIEARNTAARLIQAREEVTETALKEKALRAINVRRVFNFADTGDKPLRILHVPDRLCDAMGCWNGGIAGILLLFSVFFGGRLMGLTSILASATALFGGWSPISGISDYPWLVPATAVALWLFGVLFLRDTNED